MILRRTVFRSCLPITIHCASLLLSTGCVRSPEARRDRFVERGKAYLAQEDYARAILEFKNASQVSPKSAEPVYQLGVAAAGAGDVQSAVYAFRRAVVLDPRHAGAQLRLAQLMASTGNQTLLKDAENRLNALMARSRPTPELLNSMAVTKLGLGKTPDAVQLLEQVLATAPQYLNSSILLARAKALQHDTKGAEAVLQQAVNASPKDPHASFVLAKLYEAENRPADAEKEYQRAVALNPKDGMTLMALGNLQLSQNRQAEAEATLARLETAGDPKYHPAYALYLFEVGRHEEALRKMQKFAADPKDVGARTLLVNALMAMGRGSEAEKLTDAAIQHNKQDAEALLQRSQIYLNSGRAALAQQDLAHVVSIKPNSAEAHYYLAVAHAARRAELPERTELYEAMRLNPRLVAARIALANLLIWRGDYKSALDVMAGAPAEQRDTLPVIVERNWALLGTGNLREFEAGIRNGFKIEAAPDLFIQESILHLMQNDKVGARAPLEKVLQRAPEDLRALELLARTYDGDGKGATAALRDQAQKHPQSAPVQAFWAEYLWNSGDPSTARTILTRVAGEHPEFERAPMLLARIDGDQGRFPEARTRLQSMIKEGKGGEEARLVLATVEHASGNWQAAIKGYKEFLTLEPENYDVLNNLAFLLCEKANQPDEALTYAQKAMEIVKGRSPTGAVEDTLGWVLYRKGLYPTAVQHLQEAVAIDDKPVREYHLAAALFRAGSHQKGEQALSKAQRQAPDLPEAKVAQDARDSTKHE